MCDGSLSVHERSVHGKSRGVRLGKFNIQQVEIFRRGIAQLHPARQRSALAAQRLELLGGLRRLFAGAQPVQPVLQEYARGFVPCIVQPELAGAYAVFADLAVQCHFARPSKGASQLRFIFVVTFRPVIDIDLAFLRNGAHFELVRAHGAGTRLRSGGVGAAHRCADARLLGDSGLHQSGIGQPVLRLHNRRGQRQKERH
ncbi:hypothetical protein [Lysobacter sp. H23M47]|uniref:hypothetical protein n=1 Tax=Lysobacter sp. H23M47 TaxID=2781024 RepID=UPI00187E2D07|nr:hypothetical protein [Lysobacter sp. H23M47]QOW25918.1 hypothetical protein INQ43_06580 [Lysobacter sp. H23M47]